KSWGGGHERFAYPCRPPILSLFSAKYGRASRGILLSSRERRSRKLAIGFGPVILRAQPRISLLRRRRRSPRAWPKLWHGTRRPVGSNTEIPWFRLERLLPAG